MMYVSPLKYKLLESISFVPLSGERGLLRTCTTLHRVIIATRLVAEMIVEQNPSNSDVVGV